MKLTMKRGSDHMPSKQDSNSSMPTTDEELQKNMVGELKPHNAPITLAEYDLSWPELPALEAAGYTLRIRESDWFEHRLFKGPDTDINLHVFSSGTSEINRMLRFRDWLRSNETDREKYAQVKRSLAENKWRHVQHYANAKTSIVQEIMERANANNT